MRKFEGRVAVVTGAGGGIGRALSIALAERGCDLALADINEEGLKATAEAVGALGRKASIHVVDVTSAERMAALPDEVLGEHGRVNILINNAGVSHTEDFVEIDVKDFEWMVGINLMGVLYGCRYFLPHLLEQDEAHIVTMSSMLGFVGMPSQTLYSATKFAVRGFTESLWAELADTSVGVTCVFPGAVRTNIMRSARVKDKEYQTELVDMIDRHSMSPEDAAAKIVKAIAKNKAKQVICAESHAFHWVRRVSPKLMDKAICAFYRRQNQDASE